MNPSWCRLSICALRCCRARNLKAEQQSCMCKHPSERCCQARTNGLWPLLMSSRHVNNAIAAGDNVMLCVPESHSVLLAIVLPLALVGAAVLALMVLLCGHKQLFNDFRRWRIHLLKSRLVPDPDAGDLSRYCRKCLRCAFGNPAWSNLSSRESTYELILG